MNSYCIEIRSYDLDIYKINEKIFELKKIINSVNDSNQFLERTKLIDFKNLEELNDIENLNSLINNDKFIKELNDIDYNDERIKDIYISIFELSYRNIINEIDSYENKVNNIPDVLKKSIKKDNFLNKLYLKKKKLQFCLQILILYSSLNKYFNNEFYFSKNLDNINYEIYTIGLEILNLRKIKEEELKIIYDEYDSYINILNLLNFYQKKKLFIYQ